MRRVKPYSARHDPVPNFGPENLPDKSGVDGHDGSALLRQRRHLLVGLRHGLLDNSVRGARALGAGGEVVRDVCPVRARVLDGVEAQRLELGDHFGGALHGHGRRGCSRRWG